MNNSFEKNFFTEIEELEELLEEEVHWIFEILQFIKKINCCCI